MRRLLRWAFSFATVVSAVVFVAVGVLWARGYRRIEVLTLVFGDAVWRLDAPDYPVTYAVDRGKNTSAIEAVSAGGRLSLTYVRFHPRGSAGIGVKRTGSYPVADGAVAQNFIKDWQANLSHRALGCALVWVSFYGEMDVRELILPCPVATFVAGVLPLASVTRLLSLRRRRPSGLCPACGYDLRATPDRCPECGAVPTEKEAK